MDPKQNQPKGEQMTKELERAFKYADDLARGKREQAYGQAAKMARLARERSADGDLVGALMAQHDHQRLAGEETGYSLAVTQIKMLREAVMSQ